MASGQHLGESHRLGVCRYFGGKNVHVVVQFLDEHKRPRRVSLEAGQSVGVERAPRPLRWDSSEHLAAGPSLFLTLLATALLLLVHVCKSSFTLLIRRPYASTSQSRLRG